MNRITLSLVLAGILLCSSLLYGQLDDRQMFAKGLASYNQKDYQEAQNAFFLALKNFPDSRIQTAIKLMLAKSYYKLQEYSSAKLVISDFLEKHEASDYRDDMEYLAGNLEYQRENYDRSVELWLSVIYNGNDARLKKKAGNYVFHTMELYLTESQINSLGRKYSDEIFHGLIEIVQAKKLINSGQQEQGEIRLERFLENYPYHLYAEIASEILRGRRGPSISSNTVLVLKSGQDESRKASDALAKGFIYAAYEMSQRDKQKSLQIDTVTVGTNILSVLQTTTELLDRKQPLAVIGTVDDDENTALALLSRYEYFLFISPFSAQKGLASLSPYTFQINSDAEIKGRFLAEYAIRELGLKTFATLAPADPYGISLVKGFEDMILENMEDAELVEKQWFYMDTQDFSRQFKTIRNLGFYISFRDSIIGVDSTLIEEQIQEQFQTYLSETLFSSENRREIDSTQVASKGIDALFIATYPEYIQYIAPQFAFQNIQTQLLGNEGWNNTQILQQHRVYLDGLVYISSGYFDPESWNYKAFLNRFRQQMQETPELFHLLGYDIGKWLISQYQPGISRGSLRDRLANSGLYQGIFENIDFSIKRRVNSELNIIRFYRGQILKVK